jgi:hypothetical protein
MIGEEITIEGDSQSGIARSLEWVGLAASVLAAAAIVGTIPGLGELAYGSALLGVGGLVLLAVFYAALAHRWQAEWPAYAAEVSLVGAYLYHSGARPLPESLNALVLVLFCFLDFGFSQVMERQQLRLWARPSFYLSLLMPLLPLVTALWRGRWDEAGLLILFSSASFYGLVGYEKGWRGLGYLAGLLYNLFLWSLWAKFGWRLAAFPQLYLIPVGLSAILYAEVNREELGRQAVNAIRAAGSTVIYLSSAVPMWQFETFGAWLTLLLLSLAGIFAGIGLRVQTFVWLGLFYFLFAVLYPLGRFGMEHALARWAIMLGLGVALVLFAALSEKKGIVETVREYYEEVRGWE